MTYLLLRKRNYDRLIIKRHLLSLFLYEYQKSPVNTIFMKLLKYISIIVIALQLQIGFSQSYDFVPERFNSNIRRTT